jgi:Zn-dependent metalloprotease
MRRLIVVVFLCVVSTTAVAGHLSREARDAHIDAARTRAVAHLRENAVALGIRDVNDLKEEQVTTDKTTTASFRYQQFDRGIKVLGGQLLVIVDADRVSVLDKIVKALNLPDGAKMTANQAEAIATRQLALKGRPEEVSSELMVLPKGSLNGTDEPSTDTFAWMVTIRVNADTDQSDVRQVGVDAISGRVLSNVSTINEVTNWLGGPALRGMYEMRQPSLYGPVDHSFNMRYVLVRDPCYGTGLPLSSYMQYVSNGPDSRLCGHTQAFSPSITG